MTEIEKLAEATKSHRLWAAYISFIKDFAKESDRAAVVLGAAKLDQLLYELLQRTLLPCSGSQDELLDTERPLGTFSSRIHACYRLGLIDAALARALHLVRRIRNEFAHEVGSTLLSVGSNRDRVRALVAPIHDSEVFEFLSTEFKDAFSHADAESKDFRVGLALVCARLEGAVGRARQVGTGQMTYLDPPKGQ